MKQCKSTYCTLRSYLLVLDEQRANKVVSDSLGLVDFAIRLVNFVRNLPNGQVRFFAEFKSQKNREINSAYQMFLG